MDYAGWLKRKGYSGLTSCSYYYAGWHIVTNGYDVTSKEDMLRYYNEVIMARGAMHYFGTLAFAKFVLGNKEFKAVFEDFPSPPPIKPPRPRVPLTDEDVDAIIDLIPSHRFKMMAALQHELGVRSIELLRLKREDVTFDPVDKKVPLRILMRGKGDRRVQMWLYDDTVKTRFALYLETVSVDAVHVFLVDSRTGKGSHPFSEDIMHVKNYWLYSCELKEALDELGIDRGRWNTHDFRRRMARKVWEKYKDVSILKDMLHHSRVTTTLRYLSQSSLAVRDVQRELWADARR